MSVKQVLVVEKDTLQAFLLEERLVESGWEVHLVTNPDSALNCCEAKAFDVAVINYKYKGGIDGYRLAQLLRERCSIPSLMITATRYVELERNPLFSPQQEILFKPYRLTECARRLKALMG